MPKARGKDAAYCYDNPGECCNFQQVNCTTRGTFVQVTAGLHFSCGLRTNGSVACWGDNTWGKATPPNPSERFTRIASPRRGTAWALPPSQACPLPRAATATRLLLPPPRARPALPARPEAVACRGPARAAACTAEAALLPALWHLRRRLALWQVAQHPRSSIRDAVAIVVACSCHWGWQRGARVEVRPRAPPAARR